MPARSIHLLGGAALLMATTAPALAQASQPGGASVTRHAGWNGSHRWGPRHNGRWYAGWRAPGGWNGYQRPVRGYVLPGYWISPSFHIPNYRAYGLPVPAAGYGWSRYYDDAVMTDRQGRVYDSRSDIDWGRYEGGYDEGYDQGGAPPPGRRGADYDYGYADDAVTYGGDYEGRWVGTWTDENGKSYSGEYQGRYEGKARGRYGVDYDPPAYGGPSHWAAPQPGPALPPGGYISGGYYYPPATVTTVVINPDGTTHATTRYATPER